MGERKRTLKKDVKKLTCIVCGKEKTLSPQNWFKSNRFDYQNEDCDGYANVCKTCLRSMCYHKGSTTMVNPEGFADVLKILDVPLIRDQYLKQLADRFDLGMYLKNVRLNYKEYSFAESDEIAGLKTVLKSNDETVIETSEVNIKQLEEKWGLGYNETELVAFEKKYNLLKNNYSEKTSMHTEALLKYIRYSCKEEMATAVGNVKEAKDWAEMANKAATNAKINPSQLSKADLSDGLSTFSELAQAVEKEVDIIPILPKFKCRPNDALDFNIWCYINYMRDLQGLPLCNYEDVYKFYDDRKKEYVAQYGDPYGIFTDDTSEKNRENIKKFIQEDGSDK